MPLNERLDGVGKVSSYPGCRSGTLIVLIEEK